MEANDYMSMGFF